MTAANTLYSVRTDTGLGGLVVGREAADELVTVLGSRPDVLTVTATPMKPCHICRTYHYNACPALWGGDPEVPDGMPSYAEQRVAIADAETLTFLEHGEPS